MNRVALLVLRGLITFTLLVSVFGQVVAIPNAVADEARLHPELTDHVTAYSAVGIVGVLCVQVALVAALVLLSMAETDRLFTQRAFPWVNVVIGATAAATALTTGFGVHMLSSEIPGPPAQILGVGGLAFGGFALLLVLLVMRGLLRRATAMEDELAVVV
ncbi:DUF2975 domain-containing protein [Allokutzneria sp. NRRL B-24872]|uniref:DUF2975 domain-containing protein n=1 Tax=Allokutzneria sp. NRRL B-24872 TaxID=1137961 RepID=UPI000A3BC870|nr:DUF2975 domain-containing protein [Allokutzneria sp. NRRL B-24872]